MPFWRGLLSAIKALEIPHLEVVEIGDEIIH